MRTDKYIDESVEILKNNYLKKMLETKQLFFRNLQEGNNVKDFKNKLSEIWEDLDYQFMKNQQQDLEKIIDELNKVSLDKPAKEYFKTINVSAFEDVFKRYEKTLSKYYENRLSTIEKDIDDVDTYLSNFVNKYDDYQASIPYYNKNGTIHSYHDISDYCSMLFNTNLLRTALNRSMLDADYLGIDLMYVPAHNLSCPLCVEWQGKVYSKSGKDKRYPKLEEAYSNGLGHPNCKHIAVPFWDESQIQEDRFDSIEWEEAYKIDQKTKALDREIKKAKNDLKIYRSLNNTTEIEKAKNKIKRLRNRRSELN